ncbi:MAG: helix-turn-helix transcriptional regulator, partial [Alphaproteobacteria bacterium]|nr:helix-turn-helix transcriptional regulator [Alphaproteobacteria bacterium]
LQSVFGLSFAEARVAIAVAEGASLPALAARFEVAHATVRTQLRCVFEKTGTRRQSELAALIARLA